jgi:hypothetical protein
LKGITKILLAFASVFLVASCSNLKEQSDERLAFVAKAGDEELSREELNENLISTGSSKDSNGMAGQMIERWAIESLFYQEALRKLNVEEMSVDKAVENYRKSLINYIYQTKIIEANLDTNVSRKEIEIYYDENKANFFLKDDIVKVNYYKIPLKSQALDKMKKLFYATGEKEKEQLRNYSVQYAENFFANDSTWLYLEDMKKEIPKLREQTYLNLYPGKVVELTDELFYYFLRIRDVRSKNGLSPINFERQNIKSLIINRRKIQLIQKYKLQLLENARAERKFSVY